MKNVFFTLLFFVFVNAHGQKQVFIPTEFSTDPALSTWSYSRSAQSENFILFWGPVVGTDPSIYSGPDLRFTPSVVLDTLEKIYEKYIKEIHFCSEAPNTNLGKYKLIIVVNETWPSGGPTGWAFGGSYDNTIGAMWVHPNATRDGGVTSHELTHSLQAQNNIDRNKTGGFNFESAGFFWETHANFMRTQMYPSFVKDDMARWLATGSYHWSSTRHHYDAFNLLYTIQQQDSLGMVNRLWQESQANEHPLMTYRRLKRWSQQQLNDFIYDYAKRQVTADYTANGEGAIIRAERNRLKRDEPHYLWRQYTLLQQTDSASGRYAVPLDLAPQDYGYNIIPLYTTCANRQVQVKFKGHSEANAVAGWRYGFVAVKGDDSSARYSPFYAGNEEEMAFEMNPGETKLFLVIVGAPAIHTSYVWEPGFPKINRFPYELSIHNAVPEGYQQGFRNEYRTAGHVHTNGGGWVSNASTVDATVYVGPRAIVRPGCTITGNARIEGNAWVEGSVIKDNTVISGNANIFFGNYSNTAKVTGNAIANYCILSGNAMLEGNALLWGVTLSNGVVAGGDAEIGNCSTPGVYLQTPHPNNGRTDCDGKDGKDPSNIDINSPVAAFTALQLAIPDPISCTAAIRVDNLAPLAIATTSYVSPWETLSAVNDGYLPANSNDKSNGAYGNWPNPNSLQWVEYNWTSNYIINKIEIYWFDDGGGVLVPTTAYLEYWNGTQWTSLGNVSLAKDVFNVVDVNDVTTGRIRVSMKNTSQSTGILEWRVWGYLGTLPVKLISFTGYRKKGDNFLDWKIAGEENFRNYDIEYSIDATHFGSIGTVKAVAAAGLEHEYHFTHTVNSSISYYRLRLNDMDGRFSYGPVILLKDIAAKKPFSIYNNPVNSNLAIETELSLAGKGSITVFDINGKKMIVEQYINFVTGAAILNLPVGYLSNGTYFVRIHLENNPQTDCMLRFIKL